MGEYILLRKENDPLKSLIGQSFNQKAKFEADKILNEIHSIAQARTINKKAICYIVDKKEIKGVGGSTLMQDKKTGEIISNLILNNFGEWLSGIFKLSTIGNRTVVMRDGGNFVENVNTYGIPEFNNSNVGFGCTLEVGSGITPASRTDFGIETNFATAPEANRFQLGTNPIYNTTNFNFKPAGTITAGGSGTVNESVCQCLWDNNASGLQEFALFRDIISPGIGFGPGNSITLEYTVQM